MVIISRPWHVVQAEYRVSCCPKCQLATIREKHYSDIQPRNVSASTSKPRSYGKLMLYASQSCKTLIRLFQRLENCTWRLNLTAASEKFHSIWSLPHLSLSTVAGTTVIPTTSVPDSAGIQAKVHDWKEYRIAAQNRLGVVNEAMHPVQQEPL